MASRSCCLALSAALGLYAAPGAAAVVERKEVSVRVDEAGNWLEQGLLRVRLESDADVQRWRTYPVYLDENRRLEAVSASILRADGRRERLGEDSMDEVGSFGSGTHSSARFRVVEFGAARPGDTLSVSYRVAEEPYFAGNDIVLSERDPIENLTVEIESRQPNLRWWIAHEPDGLSSTATGAGVSFHGRIDGRGQDDRPVRLHAAWGADDSWAAVGHWYEQLTRDLPETPADLLSEARGLWERRQAPRAQLEDAIEFVRGRVRYVAVEVGIGGFRPSPPQEVLERGWGDCKDKAFFLMDILSDAGLRSYPALIRAARDEPLEVAFPSPYQFNHLIVAVDVEELEPADGDPVANGYLFLDPTLEAGGVSWLHPWTQGRQALVVRTGGSHLVRTPILARQQEERLVGTLKIADSGSASGTVRLTVRGGAARGVIEAAARGDANDVLRELFETRLHGLTLSDPSWETDSSSEVPAIVAETKAEVEGLVQGSRTRSLSLPSLDGAPGPDEVERESTAGLIPRVARTEWNLELPKSWCAIEPDHFELANTAGSYRQALEPTPNGARLTRTAETTKRWLRTADDFEAATELALAAHRAERRRVRLTCASAGSGPR